MKFKVYYLVFLMLSSCSSLNKSNRNISSTNLSEQCVAVYNAEAEKLNNQKVRKRIFGALSIVGGIGSSAADLSAGGTGIGVLAGLMLIGMGSSDLAEAQQYAANALFTANVSSLINEIQSGVLEGPHLVQFTTALNELVYESNKETSLLWRMKYRKKLKNKYLQTSELKEIMLTLINSGNICANGLSLTSKEFVEIVESKL